jgi:hypothetical protein
MKPFKKFSMNESDKTRIEKEAVKLFADNGPLVRGYIMGAHAEHTRAWNAALDKAIDTLVTLRSDVYHVLRGKLESLKIKE